MRGAVCGLVAVCASALLAPAANADDRRKRDQLLRRQHRHERDGHDLLLDAAADELHMRAHRARRARTTHAGRPS